MFSKFISTSALILALSATQAYAHCAIAPQLGIKGTPVRNDVQRPSKNSECGSTNIAANLDTSTAVPVSSSNTFQVQAINFNGGQDGSTQMTALVDATGTGKSFVSAKVTKNGVLAPPAAGSAQIEVELPSGTKCTGGKAKNLCLVSFTTAGGFGNCVVVSQAASSSQQATTSAKQAATTSAAKAEATTTAAAAQSEKTVTVTHEVTKTVTVAGAAQTNQAVSAKTGTKGKKAHKKGGKKGGKKAAAATNNAAAQAKTNGKYRA